MKKLCVGFFVVLIAAVVSYAQTGAVYSLNIVGFQRLTAVSQGLTLVSTPFERSPSTIDDVIGPQLTGGKSQGVADKVLFWDPNNQAYKTYWLRSADSNWYTLDGSRATNTSVTTMNGFWLQTRVPSNQVVIVSGDVVDSVALTNFLVPGLNLVSYPFSTEIELNNSALTNGKAGKSEGVADKVLCWDANSQLYETYWLRLPDRKFYNLRGSLATNVKIGGGVGFWYQNRDTNVFTWVERKPYSW